MRKLKDLFSLLLIVPVMTGTPASQEKPDFQASPSGLVKQDFNFKVEGYVKQLFDQMFEIKEKIPAPPINLKIEGLIPAPVEEPSTEVAVEQTKPRGAAPRVVEMRIDGSSAVVSLSIAGEAENTMEPKETETEQLVEFLNACHFSGPEPTSVEIKDLPPSRYELSPKFSVGGEGILLAKTGDYLVRIRVPVSVRAGLEGEITGDAALRNLEGKTLILPYQAIELAQKRNRLATNIVKVELTEYGENPSVYRVESFEKLNFLGLVTFRTVIETMIDGTTGRTLKQPWFSKLPSLLIKNTT